MQAIRGEAHLVEVVGFDSETPSMGSGEVYGARVGGLSAELLGYAATSRTKPLHGSDFALVVSHDGDQR